MPSLTALRAFDASAREGSFAGAARVLNVTQAAVAQQVRALEADLGLALAVRQGRSVELTEAGRDLARVLSESLLRIAEYVEVLRDRARDRPLRVTSTPLVVDRIIVPRLSEFWQAHPGTEISMFPSRTFLDLVRERYDLAIRAVVPWQGHDWPGLEARLLRRVQMIGIASPRLAETAGGNANSIPWLWHDGMERKSELMRGSGLDVDAIKQVRIGSPNLLLEAVRQGLGATIFNERVAREEIAAGGIAEVPLPRTIKLDYVALTPKGPQHPLARAFSDWVETLL